MGRRGAMGKTYPTKEISPPSDQTRWGYLTRLIQLMFPLFPLGSPVKGKSKTGIWVYRTPKLVSIQVGSPVKGNKGERNSHKKNSLPFPFK
jgi:hypothetical protein